MRVLILLSLLVLVSGCATPVYQQSLADGKSRNGYTEVKLSNVQYRVTYLDANTQAAYKGFMRRAAELTLANNKKYFSTKDIGALQEDGQPVTYYMNLNMPKYEATVVLEDKETKDNYEAQSILSNMIAAMPEPVKKPASQSKPASTIPSAW